jgi:hypothetical protein
MQLGVTGYVKNGRLHTAALVSALGDGTAEG